MLTVTDVPAGADGKLGRMDAQSPVQAQTSQQGQNQSGHQQAYINPTIPPGYYNYYPGGMLPSGYSYTPTMFPVGNIVSKQTSVGPFLFLPCFSPEFQAFSRTDCW